MPIAGYISEVIQSDGKPVTKNYFFRTTDNPEVREKIKEFLLWAKEKNYLELSDVPEARVASPMWQKYVAPRLVSGLDNINNDDGPEGEGNIPTKNPTTKVAPTTDNPIKRKRGRPKGSKNGVRREYVPTGRKRGRPKGSKNRPK